MQSLLELSQFGLEALREALIDTAVFVFAGTGSV
jgi:hypothetical protein